MVGRSGSADQRSGALRPITADATMARHWNEHAVITAMHGRGPLRAATIAQLTGLTSVSVRMVLQGLVEKQWISTRTPSGAERGRGRPAQLFSLRQPDAWVLGLDVGAHNVRGVRMGLDGEVATRHELRLPKQAGLPERREGLAEVVEALCAEVPDEVIWLSTLAVGGLTRDGVVVSSVAVPDFEGERPTELFADLVPGLRLLTNDVFASTFAEHRAGAARGVDDLVYVHLGLRPTLGLFLNGSMRAGHGGLAGDMSRMHQIPTLPEHFTQRFEAHRDPLAAAIRAGVEGDPAVRSQIDAYVAELLPPLTLVAAAIDPALLCIGGSLSPLGSLVVDPIRDTFAEHLQHPPAVVPTAFDQYSAALGAAHVGLAEIQGRLVDQQRGTAPLTRESLVALAG